MGSRSIRKGGNRRSRRRRRGGRRGRRRGRRRGIRRGGINTKKILNVNAYLLYKSKQGTGE
jgi:hypothetical protein